MSQPLTNSGTPDHADLAQRVEMLERLVLEREVEHKSAIAERDALIADLEAYIFGRRTERREDPGQLQLFESSAAASEGPSATEEESARATRPSRSRKQAARRPFPDDLHRNDIPVDPPENERICAECGKPLVRIGEDVTERLHVVPRRFVVNRYIAGRWGCPNRDGGVQQAPLPGALVDRSRYETSVYAMIIASKYLLHLPLHRLEADFRGQGIELNRSTMWGLVERGEELVAPIVDEMEHQILASSYVQMDDSFLTVTTPKRKGSQGGHLWVIRHGQKVVYRFTLKRNREKPKDLLAAWKGGFLQVDGHDSFEAVSAGPT